MFLHVPAFSGGDEGEAWVPKGGPPTWCASKASWLTSLQMDRGFVFVQTSKGMWLHQTWNVNCSV